MEKKRRARVRTKMITLRLTPQELTMLKDRAKDEGRTLTNLLIYHALKARNRNRKEVEK